MMTIDKEKHAEDRDRSWARRWIRDDDDDDDAGNHDEQREKMNDEEDEDEGWERSSVDLPLDRCRWPWVFRDVKEH